MGNNYRRDNSANRNNRNHRHSNRNPRAHNHHAYYFGNNSWGGVLDIWKN